MAGGEGTKVSRYEGVRELMGDIAVGLVSLSLLR